jgi:hypothetical protein
MINKKLALEFVIVLKNKIKNGYPYVLNASGSKFVAILVAQFKYE